MKKILSLIKFDITNALRDNMIIYIFLAPLLLAGGLRLFLPSFEGSVVRFALEVPSDPALRASSGAEDLAERLKTYGRVETFPAAADVLKRVLATDDAGGIILSEEAGWTILLQGNEGEEGGALMRSVLNDALSGPRIGEYTLTKKENRSPFKEYASVGLMMLSFLIGGLAISFAMVDEKEQTVTKAFSVTPLTPAAYFAARGLLSGVIGFVVAIIGHFILTGGTETSLGPFLLALIAGAPLPLLIVLIIGGISKNQIQALAVLKIVMTLYLSLPFVTIIVPRTWHWLFYIFPNYWMFRTFESIYVTGARTGDLPLAAGITVLTGTAALIALGVGLGKQLKPR